MALRRRISKRGGRRLFSATARKVHKRNLGRPMRGGIRL